MKFPGEVTAEEYTRFPAVNWSTLSNMRKSPKHYQHGLTAVKTSQALTCGSALHTLVFEPETWDDRCVVYRKPKNKGKGSRTEFEEFKAANSSRLILTEEDEMAVRSMAQTVLSHPANKYLARSQGRAEVPLTWHDPDSGLHCKGRLDYVTLSGIVIDLKSARSTEIRTLGRQAWTLGYFHQLAFYRRGLAQAMGRTKDAVDALIIAVENEAPYDCTICELDGASLAEADSEISSLLDRLASCLQSNKWPGRYDKPQVLTAPSYVLMDDGEGFEVTITKG